MDTKTFIEQELAKIRANQAYKKPFDFTRDFVAKAGTLESFVIPMTNEGPFLCTGYNIRYTKNTTMDRGGVVTNLCAVKLQFKSQADNSAQSNDLVPVQLIATPGDENGQRYGSRPWYHLYPKGDALIIQYDNRQPAALVPGDTYTMQDEKIQICFTGYIFPNSNI
jgi:hypothetical protein